ncbi:keratin, type I cytoskeletal 19-like [Etheostoma cragini]|uniref:keratin, type I cytoskeletal 19-like n=1 Tax=Etheostoma cragini TaxID=417921 RepID=UPI00155F0298|nr:keratin, type I cytoskeletal 19-like [Etheostoma cragini]
MSLSFSRQSSYSARRLSSGSAIRLSRGVQLVGDGQTLISTGSLQRRTPSVYGGAGGYGTRISQSAFSSSGSLSSYGETAVINNEKVTMQNLNDRLSSYLDKVRLLESANRKLELQIKEFYEKKVTVSSDYTNFFTTIAELRAQIMSKYSENRRIILQIDNAQMAADDFKTKYEAELKIHMAVEADVLRLRGTRDSLTLNITDLEMQLEGLKEELVYMKTAHEEEKRLLNVQQAGMVNVEVDSKKSVDLTLILQEIREQYEAMVVKNKQEVEKWFQSKVELLNSQITTCTTEGKTFSTQLSELKKTLQTVEISRESLLKEIQCLQQNKEEVNSRYTKQLSQQQLTINTLEVELQQLRVSLEQQQADYNLLLDIKMRLELEIAEYRRLLEGESYEQKKTVVISKVVEVQVEEHKPHIERRVKTIVEEIVDGKVVSSTVDTQVQEIQ